jgi:mannose-1-phosphate guanylyltransferase
VDPYVEAGYYRCLKTLSEEASKPNAANLTLMGIEPTEPSEKFGYIIPVTSEHLSAVSEFKEKPTREAAEAYIRQGALWNGGMFAFKLSYILEIAKRLFGTAEYDGMYEKYAELEKISFDYAVVEKEKSTGAIQMLRSAIQQKTGIGAYPLPVIL